MCLAMHPNPLSMYISSPPKTTMSLPTQRTLYRRSRGPPPNTLTLHHEPLPPLSPTAILVQVHAVSLNYRDANILHGTNPWPTLEAGIPCSDAAGTVLALGSHVTRVRVGDRVGSLLDRKALTGDEQEREWLGGEVEGVLASHLVVDEQCCVRVPAHLGWAEAACLPNAGLTAWSSLVDEGSRKLSAGGSVLVQGTGGVSLMALKLAAAGGRRVFVTSSSDDKLERVKAMAAAGVVHGVNYATHASWDEEVLRLNGGSGVDIVIENGGASSIKQSLNAVKKGGIVSQVGYLGKQDARQLDGLVPLLIDKTATWRGINVGSRRDFERMNQMIESSKLRFDDLIDRSFSFDEAPQAFSYLWQGAHVGKVVITMP